MQPLAPAMILVGPPVIPVQRKRPFIGPFCPAGPAGLAVALAAQVGSQPAKEPENAFTGLVAAPQDRSEQGEGEGQRDDDVGGGQGLAEGRVQIVARLSLRRTLAPVPSARQGAGHDCSAGHLDNWRADDRTGTLSRG